MKPKLFIVAAMLVCFTAALNAQNPAEPTKNPEEAMLKKSENMAGKLLLSDADAAKFVPVYMEYLKANKAINEKYKPAKKETADGKKPTMTDKDIEAQLRAQFAKSQEVLDLRKAYLDKYLKVLSPRQVRELYKIEQEQMHRMAEHRGQKPQK